MNLSASSVSSVLDSENPNTERTEGPREPQRKLQRIEIVLSLQFAPGQAIFRMGTPFGARCKV